jgi:hypothetical protein
MKILVNIFALIGALFVVLFLVGSFSNSESSGSHQALDKNNYDGTYNVNYGNSTCGNLGYIFKKQYHRNFDTLENPGSIRKSNCKSINGKYQGYIYPANKPYLRIYWTETKSGGVVLLKEK